MDAKQVEDGGRGHQLPQRSGEGGYERRRMQRRVVVCEELDGHAGSITSAETQLLVR